MILFKANDANSTKEVTGFLISHNRIENQDNLYKYKCPRCKQIFEKIKTKDKGNYFEETCPDTECGFSDINKRSSFLIQSGDVYVIKPETLSLSLDNGLTWHSNLENLNIMLNLLKKRID